MKRPKKEIVNEKGEIMVWCSGCKAYHYPEDFYPVSGRKYDTYCKMQRKAKEKSFYYRYKHNNPDYMPTIRRVDNAHLFIGSQRKKQEEKKREVDTKQAHNIQESPQERRVLLRRIYE